MPVISIVSASAMGSLAALAAFAFEAEAAVAVTLWLAAGSLGTLPALRHGMRGARNPDDQTR